MDGCMCGWVDGWIDGQPRHRVAVEEAAIPIASRCCYFDSTGNAKNRELAFCTRSSFLNPRPPKKALP